MTSKSLFFLLAAVACSSGPVPASPPVVAPAAPAARPPAVMTADPELAALWPDGCFVVGPPAAARASDPGRCALPRRPYSTFKIPNALIGADAGLLPGPDAPMAWDEVRVPRQGFWMDAWSGPHTLRTAMEVSAVPHFRTLALLLGADRMAAGLARLAYGNQDTSGGLDLFWLRGGMRISAAEQLAFVDALAHGTLAVSPAAQATVRAVLERDRQGAAVLYGKTGTGDAEDGSGRWIAWQVGWVEVGSVVTPYAAWFESSINDIPTLAAERTRRVREVLAKRGLIAAP